MQTKSERESKLTVDEVQAGQPWVVPYSVNFDCAVTGDGEPFGPLLPYLYSTHAVLHAIKSLGKIASVFESLDHRAEPIAPDELELIRAMSADLFTIALRFANLHQFSLVSALRDRVLEKNGIDIAAKL